MVLENRIISRILLFIIIIGCLWSGAYTYIFKIIKSAVENVGSTDALIQFMSKNDTTEEEAILSYETITTEYLDSLPFKRIMVDLNGYIAKNLNLRELYQNNGGIVLSNGYVAGIYPSTTADYEFQQTLELKEFLDDRGIQLLYVNEPTKYFDDIIIQEDMGKKTYANANTDLFLSKLEDAGINYIDLRDVYTQMGFDSFELFYRTDHHWTVPAGKIAAETISVALNEKCGYNIDLSLYENEKFTITHFDNSWLGSQGRKLGAPFIGMDDYDMIFPDYDTDYTVTYKNGKTYTGSFDDVLISKSVYLPERNVDIYNAPSWHYSYMNGGLSQSIVVNNSNSEGKKILILGDSFEQVTVPFLSLGVSEIQTLVLRNYKDSLRDYIDTHDIDTVIIAYVSSMISEHNNEASVNYSMFDFQ